ncbi:MAG: hypothetical protein OER43_06210 [Gammaproteobacteria bacterium]|nr:hypothetical protein [Gammaproteobacteria bacterium]
MKSAIAAIAIQNHRIRHAPQAAPVDQIVNFVDALQHGEFTPATLSHLRHEGKRIETAILIQRFTNFLNRTDFDSIANSKSENLNRAHPQRLQSQLTFLATHPAASLTERQMIARNLQLPISSFINRICCLSRHCRNQTGLFTFAVHILYRFCSGAKVRPPNIERPR